MNFYDLGPRVLLNDIAGTIVAGVSADIHPDAPAPRISLGGPLYMAENQWVSRPGGEISPFYPFVGGASLCL